MELNKASLSISWRKELVKSYIHHFSTLKSQRSEKFKEPLRIELLQLATAPIKHTPEALNT
jgi:hypothetical protein